MKVRFAVAPGVGWLERQQLLSFADTLEASGFDGVWLADLPVGALIDPMLGLAIIAARTTRLKLGANIVPLGRNPFLLAKELAQLDQVSEGRVLLSFVPGIGMPGEREVLGIDGVARQRLLEDALLAVRAHWESPDESLAHVTRPVQQPLEVWLGGHGPKALERVGRLADGWLGANVTPAESRAARERIQESAAACGREVDPEHFGLSIGYARSVPDPEVLAAISARRDDVDPLELLPVGREQLRASVERYLEAGLSKFVLRPVVPVQDWRDETAWLADAVLALQT